jgi:hypothetical protein
MLPLLRPWTDDLGLAKPSEQGAIFATKPRERIVRARQGRILPKVAYSFKDRFSVFEATQYRERSLASAAKQAASRAMKSFLYER